MSEIQTNQALPGAGAPESGVLDNGRVWLNTAGVVDRLIRSFALEVLGAVSKEDFLPWLDLRCRAMNGLFLGTSPSEEFERNPKWNTPDQLGESLLHRLRIDGEPRLAVRDGFMVFASKMIKASQAGEFDPAAMDAMVGELRGALLDL